MRTVDEVQIALLAYLKAQTSLTVLLASAGQIKETQWQGVDFVYPAVRLGLDVMPNKQDCPPDEVEGSVFVFTEDKSSRRCSQISGEVSRILHRLSFTSAINGVKFMRIYVVKEPYPTQSEGSTIWQSQVQITAQVS